jgi:T5SS/PEP-CTERM-associated repeat protein/autotransporter-associated beta strand protein
MNHGFHFHGSTDSARQLISGRWSLACVVTIFAVAAATLPATVAAQDREWVGATSSDWFTAGNWLPVGVPGAGEHVVIDTDLVNAAAVESDSATVSTLWVGADGAAELTILNGGTVTNSLGTIGRNTDGEGEVTVTGVGSAWTNTALDVAYDGWGRLRVEDGATVTDTGTRLAVNAGADGRMFLKGSDTAFISNTSLRVAQGGVGEILIEEGAQLSSQLAVLGFDTGSLGWVTIKADSLWTNQGNLVVGRLGTGQLSVDGGEVHVLGDHVVMGALEGGHGTIGVTAGGVLAVFQVKQESTFLGNNFGFEGGTLRLLDDQPALFEGVHDISTSGFGIIDTQSFTVATAATITGNGGMIKRGSGVLIFSANQAFTGDMQVEAGTLLLFGQDMTGATYVEAGATLGGHASGVAALTVEDGGTLAPGAPPGHGDPAGTLDADELTLLPGAILAYDLGPPGAVGGESDLVEVAGDLVLDGQLQVTAIDDFDIGTHTLFVYGGALTDNGLQIASMPAGFHGVLDTSVPTRVNLEVMVAVPAVDLDPEQVDFGPVVIGQTAPARLVTVTNTGSADLELGTLAVSGDQGTEFSLDDDACSGQNLLPSEQCSFSVSFTPAAVGERSAAVELPSNAVSSPDSVILEGLGVNDPLFNDRFESKD